MQLILRYILLFLPLFSWAQPVVHQGVFYRDDEGVNSGFLSDKVSEIQSQLDYLKENGVYVNVLLMAKECPRLKEVEIGDVSYFEGPEYTNNGVESSFWGIRDNQYYTFQFLPREALLYHPVSQGNSFWSVSGVDFDYPLLLHNDKYYCAIKEALNALCVTKSLDVSEPVVDCIDGQPEEVESAIIKLPQTYLQKNEVDLEELKAYQILAKTNFCTNLLYYGPYLHTRSTKEYLRDELVNTVEDGFLLATVIPDDISNSNVFKDVLLDITKGEGFPDNCYPTSRELSEQDRLEVLHKMHGANNSGASSDLKNVKNGSAYLLEWMLAADETPVPGNTNCEYGSYSGGNGFNPGNFNFVSGPEFQFHGPGLPVPGSNEHVKWYNNFDGIPGGFIAPFTQAAEAAQGQGLNLQFYIASGCTPNVPQFESSRTDFEQSNPPGAAASLWLFYDECDHRLYYDVKLPAGFTANINPGYGITNPDSIAAIRAAAEDIIEGILAEASKMTTYENADLDEGEYPENMHNGALSAFFGVGTSCDGESPWKFGIRDGYNFTVPGLAGDCLIILWKIVTDQTIPRSLWHPQPADSCMLDMPGAAAGILDGCLNLVNGKAWNLTGLLSAAVDFYKANAPTRKAVLKEISNPLNLILGQYPQNIDCIGTAECQEERIYCFTNLMTNAVFDICGAAGIRVFGNIANVGAVIDDKLKMFVPDFGDRYNEWKRTLNVGSQRKLHQFMEDVTESAKFKLTKSVTLNKIWKKFDEGQLPGVTKDDLQEFIERLPAHDQHEFYQKFDETFIDILGDIGDPGKVKAFIEDVNSLEPAAFVNVFNEFPEKYFRAWDRSNSFGLVHLRKNIGFLNTVDEFYDGSITQKFQEYGCTLIDEALMRHYTGEYYYKLNRALLGVDPMTDEFLEFRDATNQALHKLPDHNGIVYRGLAEEESYLLNQLEEGDLTNSAGWDKKFVSTSVEIETANDFRLMGNGTIIVKILPCKSGKNISAISKHKEQEVVYPTGKQFRMKSKKPLEGYPGVWEIILEEE